MLRTVFCSVLILVVSGLIENSSAQRRQMGGVGITVFTDRNFNGRSATYRDDVPDLEPLGLNDRVSSLRVGRGERWEICEHSNYQGRCVVVSGTEPDLRRNSWNDLISSMRRVNAGPLPPGPPSGNPYIVLFDRPNYRGTPITYNEANPSTPNSAQSVTIGRGSWMLCEGQNYSGRCITLDQSVPDLGAHNMRNRVFSVRPVGSGGGADPSPPTSDWSVVIFDRTNYRGTPSNYSGPETDVFKQARSITIGRGTWQFCQGRDFTGRCITLNRSVPDLRPYNIRQVGSLRPITRQPR